MRCRATERGFTLVEIVVAIVVAAVVASMLATYLGIPLRVSGDVARRAELTDRADLALRRLQRDVHRALPNSLRVRTGSDGVSVWLEYLEVRTGGRYRVEPSSATASAQTCPDANLDTLADEDVLTFGRSDDCMRTLGSLPDLGKIVAGTDYLVVYNLGANFENADAYASAAATGGNKARITAVATADRAENRIRFEPHAFTLASPGARFQIVAGPVSYECNPTTGRLRRHSNYAIAAAQPGAVPAGAVSVLMAEDVFACDIVYNNGATERSALVAMTLTLGRGGERVTLHHYTHVSNVP